MKYVGSFKDINNESYYCEIITNDDNTTIQNIEMGTPPFILEYESGDDIIYKPIKYSSATATIVSENILSDIYTGANQGTKIKLTNTQRTLFNGYITPNVYNQPYSGVAQNIELECVDGLSTLKNIDYTTVGDEKNIVSFAQIICHILKQCNCYTTLYISDVINKGEINKLYQLSVSENNFFDEDDEPMKCNEVLEEILRYLNMTMYADGLKVFIIDYDAIANNEYNAKYNVVNIADGEQLNLSSINYNKTITADNYRGANANLSIDNVYNKATVVAELYEIPNPIENMFESKELVKNVGTLDLDKKIEVWVGENGGNPNDNENTRLYNKKELTYNILHHPTFESHYWVKDEATSEVTETTIKTISSYEGFHNYIGATLYEYFLPNHTLLDDKYNIPIEYEDESDFKQVLLFHLNGSLNKYDDWHTHTFRKMCTITPTKDNILCDDNTYLYFNFSATFRNINRFFTGDNFKTDNEFTYTLGSYDKILPSIEFNIFNSTFDKYLSFAGYDLYGEDPEWWNLHVYPNLDPVRTVKPSEIALYMETTVDVEKNTATKKGLFDKSLKVLNTVPSSSGIDKKGKLIKLPKGTNVKDLRIVFYQPVIPWQDWYWDKKNYSTLQCVILEDLDIGVVNIPHNSNINDEDEENTTYENIVNENWIEEMGDITFKVCTFDGKKLNYSAVFEDIDGVVNYVDTIENKALKQKLRQEEMLIYRIVNQHKEPQIILNLELNNQYSMCDKITYPTQYNDKKFIIDSMSINFENNTTTLKIIEKA